MPTIEQYKEAAFRDGIEISKLMTALKIAGDIERERCVKLIQEAEIFHCWGDAEIDGLEVRDRLVKAVRGQD